MREARCGVGGKTTAITVWNEMKTPWQWQFDDLSQKLWPTRSPIVQPKQKPSQTQKFNLENTVHEFCKATTEYNYY
jgi:hypothetical protein